MARMKLFRLPTQVCIEPGCLRHLPQVVRERGVSRVLLVTDRHLAQREFLLAARTELERAGLLCDLFEEVESNPRTSTVERIAAQAREERAQLIVGLGGGSVLDAAKAAAMLATNAGGALDFVGRDLFGAQPLPFVAVPTTCGTGSEVTWVAVITSKERATKVSIKGMGMFPDVALVDAELLRDLPTSLLASTSMDALTHAIEACTGRLANPTSDALATEAILRIMGSLEQAVNDPAAAESARQDLACASTLAGMAFGNSDVGAVHCLSETLGGLFDVPHGLANAILLAPLQRYQLDSCAGVFARLETRLGGNSDASAQSRAFLERIEALARAVHIPPFSALNIPTDAFGDIARRSVLNGSNSSCPQTMGEEDYLRILEGLI